MTTLEVRIGPDSRIFDPGPVYMVGRSQAADIRLDDPGVSRHHADLSFDGTNWTYVDRSSGGSYVGDDRISTVALTNRTVVRLGPNGPEVEFSPQVGVPSADAPPPGPAAQSMPVDAPGIDQGPPPTGMPGPEQPAASSLELDPIGQGPEQMPPPDQGAAAPGLMPPPDQGAAAPGLMPPPDQGAAAPGLMPPPGVDGPPPGLGGPPPGVDGPPPGLGEPPPGLGEPPPGLGEPPPGLGGPPPGFDGPPPGPGGPPPGFDGPPPGPGGPPQGFDGPPPGFDGPPQGFGAPPPGPGGPPPGFAAPPQGFDGPPPGPGGPHPSPAINLDQGAGSGTIALDDYTLRLDAGDGEKVFLPGSMVIVGRNPDCNVVVNDGLASGRHCAFEYRGDKWYVQDLGSTRGTFIDGRKLTKPAPVEGAFHVVLGDDTAGVHVRVVTAGTHTANPPRSRTPLLLGGLALLVAIGGIVGTWFALSGGSDSDGSPNTGEQLAAAKESTVYIVNPEAGGTGSGAFVTDDLVLTNQHVIEGGTTFFLGVSDDEDAPVTIRYEAELEATHPFLDVALIRVVETIEIDLDAGPQVVAAIPTPDPVEIGDSTVLRTGEGINSLGFPALTSQEIIPTEDMLITPSVSVAEGEIVNFQLWPGCGGATEGLLIEGSVCSPEGDLPRGNMLSSDLSGSGGSGGPVIVDGQLVAIRYAVLDTSGLRDATGIATTGGASISIPVEYFDDWLEQNMS